MGRKLIGSAARRRVALAAMLMLAAAAIAGCGTQLETGYTYRPLNSTEAQRKAYYASPFTPEKAGANGEKGSAVAPSIGGMNSNLH